MKNYSETLSDSEGGEDIIEQSSKPALELEPIAGSSAQSSTEKQIPEVEQEPMSSSSVSAEAGTSSISSAEKKRKREPEQVPISLSLVCAECEFESKNQRIFKSHIKRFHCTVVSKVKCINCFKRFTTVDTYFEHRCNYKRQKNVTDSIENQLIYDDFSNEDRNTVYEDSSSNAFQDQERSILKLCLSLEGCHSTSQVAIDECLLTFKEFSDPEYQQFMDLLSTDKKRKKMYDSLGIFLEPQKVQLKNDKYGYIIPLKALITMLSNEDSYFKYFKSDSTTGGEVEDINDTTESIGYERHSSGKLLKDKKKIGIILYNDDVEFCNPLGMKRGKHKLTLFYITFSNVPASRRSLLHHTHLIAAVKTEWFKDFQNHKLLLQNFIDDLNSLYTDGIVLRGVQFHAFLLFYHGDALAAHQLLGFKMSFSPLILKPCRTCNIDYSEIPVISSHDLCNLRTVEIHQQQLKELENSLTENNKKKHLKLSRAFGTVRSSPLAEIINFDIFEHALHDPMHILFEGIVPKEITLMLTKLTESNILKNTKLNEQTASFEFHKTVKSSNYPRQLPTDFKIVSTSSAMHTLIVHLPFLLVLSCNINLANNKYFKCFSKLLNIVKLICSPTINEDAVSVLISEGQKHHTMYRKLYGDDAYITKHHSFLHLVEQIRKYGPGQWQSTIRKEAKHYIAKRKHYYNYKNLAYSVASTFQVNQSYHLMHNLSDDEVFYEVLHVIDTSKYAYLQEFADEVVLKINKLQFNRVCFNENDVFIINDCNSYPKFAIAKEFFKISNNLCILVENVRSEYLHNFCAYSIESMEYCHLHFLESLNFLHPMPHYHFDGKHLVIVTEGKFTHHIDAV